MAIDNKKQILLSEINQLSRSQNKDMTLLIKKLTIKNLELLPQISKEQAEKIAILQVIEQLADENLGVGDGHFYAYRVIEALGIPVEQGVLRISFVHYTSPQEVERLIATLQRLL